MTGAEEGLALSSSSPWGRDEPLTIAVKGHGAQTWGPRRVLGGGDTGQALFSRLRRKSKGPVSVGRCGHRP